MKRKLLLLVCWFACLLVTSVFVQAQPIYNQKNVTQDVLTTHYNDVQPLRVMEYSTDQAGTILQRRLEILPENDLPSMRARVLTNNFEEIPFINTPPFDALFDNGIPDFKLAATAATLLHGTEVSLKIIKDKFGWIGIDNQAVNSKPIIWNIMEPDKPEFATSPKYSPISKEFYLFAHGDEPEQSTKIDVVCHEIIHAIIHSKIGSAAAAGIDPCSERRVLEEALGDIIGLYVLNEYEQNSPAFYQWIWSQGFAYPGRPFANPNAFNLPDTYLGNFYASTCPADGDYHHHQNATVIDHWYYLLAAGTTGTETNDLGYSYQLNGIGVSKAIQIVWKCIDFLDLKSNFNDLKAATLKAAEQLYGLHSTEYLAVMDAWCAVGICENNLGPFSMSPAHGTTGVGPWPGVNVNVTWEGLQAGEVTEWEVQMATNTAFTDNVQNVLIKNFSVVVKPGGGSAYAGFATGYYRPGERVYARARITKAGANFCKGYNPLCVLYQQYGPAHAFTLDNKQAKFWHAVPSDHWTVNPWDDPSISWMRVFNSHQYTYEVAEDDTFTKIVYTGNIPYSGNFSESGIINTNLNPGQTYYTRVRGERFNSPNLTDNNGAWSDTEAIEVATPQTSIIQALNQTANDPAKPVPSLGFWVTWYPYPGATKYIIQVAKDAAFTDVVRSQTVPANINTIEFLLPSLPNQTDLFVQILPQKLGFFGKSNVWRIKTDESLMAPKMKSPADGTNFPFRNFLAVFQWAGGTLNLNMVDHFEVHVTEKTSGLTSIFTTQGKVFDFALMDQFLFDDKMGMDVRIVGVGPHGAKSAPSVPFHYNICPDHPEIIFPVDQTSQIDATQNFNIQWHDSFWFDPASEYQVTIKDAFTSVAVPGFNNKPTKSTSMLVPAGTLNNGKKYSVTVKNAPSCAGIPLQANIFSAVGAGGSNQPQPPKLVNFTIELKGFLNDPDGTKFPPEYGTSNYVFGIEFIDPDGNLLALVDPNGNQVTQLDVDSENSGVIAVGNNKPEGKYKLRLKMKNIFNPLLYYPFDQPRFSVLLNGKTIVGDHVITVDFANPASPFNEWQVGFQFADIMLDIK